MKVSFILIITIFILHIPSISSQTPSIEMRGVWVATVGNIDWPSKAGLSSKEQKKEIIEILNYYQSHNYNTIFLQVRPCSDVFYHSKIEPWSKYLTGIQGKKPHYDPLKFWINEAHKRDLEIHAWINPYRITQSSKDQLVSNHPAMLHPDWVLEYAGKKYFNPGIPEVKKYLVNVVSEIIDNYKVDGIHFDDYFYPYPKGTDVFPDSLTYQQYNIKSLSLDDWRRENVNQTIKELHQVIKEKSAFIQFGVSPFGVWRNQKEDGRGSMTNAGVTNYDHIYADVLTWMQNGWVDYVVPQIYWTNENMAVPFDHLVDWWAQNSSNCNVFIGHAIYKVNSQEGAWSDSAQIVKQIQKVRVTPKVEGSVFFSHNQLQKNQLGVADSIQMMYESPSLIPNIQTNNEICACTVNNIKQKKKVLKWNLKSKKSVKYSAIYVLLPGGEKQLFALVHKKRIKMTEIQSKYSDVIGVQITVVDRHNKESIGSEIIYLN